MIATVYEHDLVKAGAMSLPFHFSKNICLPLVSWCKFANSSKVYLLPLTSPVSRHREDPRPDDSHCGWLWSLHLTFARFVSQKVTASEGLVTEEHFPH